MGIAAILDFLKRLFFSRQNDAYITSVLLVCKANFCRSPMAEGMLRQQLLERGLSKHTRVDSSGTHVQRGGQRPDARARQMLLPSGIDIARLRSRSIQLADFVAFDYILVMDNGNYESLLAVCPEQYQHKIALIMSFAPQASVSEVPDPYYSNQAGFQQVYTFLEQAIDGLVGSIEKNHDLSD